MIKDKNILLKLQIAEKKKSSVKSNVSELLYALYSLLIENPIENFWFECFNIFLGYMQLIIYFLDSSLLSIWNQNFLIKELMSFLDYFHITPILKYNLIVYFILMDFLAIIIYIIAIIIIVLAYKIYKNKKKNNWILIFLRIVLPLVSTGFFGPIFKLFTSLFYCENGHSYVSQYLKCRTGNIFIYHSPFIIIAIVFHLIIGLLTNLLYYKSIFLMSSCNLIERSNSTNDVIFFFTKIVIILLFFFNNGKESGHWVILFFLLIFTGFNAYINILLKNRLNIKLMQLTIIFSLTLFFGSITLLIGKIFNFLGYNGSIFYYPIIIICIYLYILYNKRKDMDFILTDHKAINNPIDYISYILKYYLIFQNKNSSRYYSFVLKSFIEKREEKCIDIYCPLKMYLEKLKEGNDCVYLLFQYLEYLYNFGITRFKNNELLKISYSSYLISGMNNKKKASAILETINQANNSFHRNYTIYICKKLISEKTSAFINYYNDYRHQVAKLKNLITKTSNFYYEFWTLLYESKFQHNNKFSRLYKLGSEILENNADIEKTYKSIMKVKACNVNVHQLYLKYNENIVESEDYYKLNETNSSIYRQTFEIESLDFINFSNDILKQKNYSKYIIVSGERENIGTIMNCTTGASAVFGYTNEEIIGKHINIIIPELFHANHNKVLTNQSIKSEVKLFDDLYNKRVLVPFYIEGSFFGVLKSKFIKSFRLKVYFVKTENYQIAFFIEILDNIPCMSSLIKNKDTKDNFENRCCVLTNDNFLIHSFTSNSIDLLGLSYLYIRSNNSIVPHIKQLYDEYTQIINQINTNVKKEKLSDDKSSDLSESNQNVKISSDIKKKIKKELVTKKFNKRHQITWRITKKISKDNLANKSRKIEDNNTSRCSRISHRDSNYNILSTLKDEKNTENEFIMEIKKASINGEILGYYFYFTKVSSSEDNNVICYNISEKNDYDKNGLLKRVNKYKILFKNPDHMASDIGRKSFFHTVINNNKLNDSNYRIQILSNPKKLNFYKSQKTLMTLEEPLNSQNDNENIIDDSFIPKNFFHFSFDLKEMSYNLEKQIQDNPNSKILNDILKKEAMSKVKEYEDYLKAIKNKKKESNLSDSTLNEDSSSKDEEMISLSSDQENESSSSIESITKANSLNKKIYDKRKSKKSISISNNINGINDPSLPIKDSKTLKVINEKKEDNENNSKNENESNKKKNDTFNHLSTQMKKEEGKNYLNSYYKINLHKIHYMIFDFNRDMIINGNKNDIGYKIDKIVSNSKNKNESANFVDMLIPSYSFKKNKEKNQNIKDNKLQNDNQNKNNDENTNVKRISEAIKSKNNEETVQTFHIYSIIICIILLLLALLFSIFNVYFYNQINQMISLIKSVLNIKYCNSFSKYFLREITLLGFNVSNISGGNYISFAGHDKNKYYSLLLSKIKDYYIETRDNLENILSSSYSISKKTQKSLLEKNFESIYHSSEGLGKMSNDIFTTLIQYNSVLHNLAYNNSPIYQNHIDAYNFLENSYNNYVNAINELFKEYGKELKRLNTIILYYIILSIIIILFIYIFFVTILILSYSAAAKSRINYMKVFYGINIDSIKNLILNCKIFKEELTDEKKESSTEEEEEEGEKKSAQKVYKMNLSSENNDLTNNEKKSIISIKTILFILSYIIIMGSEYAFFPYNGLLLYKLSKRSNEIYNFLTDMDYVHINLIDIFNVYREFIYDNNTNIYNSNPFDYLMKLEIGNYVEMPKKIKSIEKYIFQNMDDIKFRSFITRDLCSFYITDYFRSVGECKQKYSHTLASNIAIFSSIFYQSIRYLRYFVKYKLDTEDIFGDLSKYETDKWSEMEEDDYKNKTFRLDLFNNEIIHSYFNILYLNVLSPYVDETRKIIINKYSLESNSGMFFLYFGIYFFILIMTYFFFFLPIIRYLNSYIYKTRKILLLIPAPILASQLNIKSLLKIS